MEKLYIIAVTFVKSQNRDLHLKEINIEHNQAHLILLLNIDFVFKCTQNHSDSTNFVSILNNLIANAFLVHMLSFLLQFHTYEYVMIKRTQAVKVN